MRFFLCLALLLTFASPALADTTQTVEKVQSYLNTMKTLKADFVQTHSDGSTLTGKFWLKRPGKLRFEYDAPIEDFIVADGFFLHFYDGQMKQPSSTPIKNSLANFFLRENIVITGDIQLSNVKEDPKSIQMTITKTQAEEAGSLTLFFQTKPLQLQKWEIVDAQGIVTTIALQNVEEGMKLKDNLFFYYDPQRRKSNINK